MTDYPLGELQYCWINRWIMSRVFPTDSSFGNGLDYLVCKKCGDKLSINSQASRRIFVVRDDFGMPSGSPRCSIDMYCLDCYDYLHQYNAELIEAVRS